MHSPFNHVRWNPSMVRTSTLASVVQKDRQGLHQTLVGSRSELFGESFLALCNERPDAVEQPRACCRQVEDVVTPMDRRCGARHQALLLEAIDQTPEARSLDVEGGCDGEL